MYLRQPLAVCECRVWFVRFVRVGAYSSDHPMNESGPTALHRPMSLARQADDICCVLCLPWADVSLISTADGHNRGGCARFGRGRCARHAPARDVWVGAGARVGADELRAVER
jgi:hypothetical protein